MQKVLCGLMAGLLLCVNARAQICDSAIKLTAPQTRFVINSDATVTDLRTGLTWQRCPAGFSLDDGGTPDVFTDDACIENDTASFGWQDALLYVQDLNQSGGFAGAPDWRLPNIKEMMSIVERQCTSPAINLAVFPGTPLGVFWSSSSPNSLSAYVLDFSKGVASTFSGDRALNRNFVRLVR